MDMAMHGDRRMRRRAMSELCECLSPCAAMFIGGFLFVGIACLVASVAVRKRPTPRPGIYNPLHEYDTRAVDDRFSRFLAAWDAGTNGPRSI